eukprot:Pgem_evm1s4996
MAPVKIDNTNNINDDNNKNKSYHHDYDKMNSELKGDECSNSDVINNPSHGGMKHINKQDEYAKVDHNVIPDEYSIPNDDIDVQDEYSRVEEEYSAPTEDNYITSTDLISDDNHDLNDDLNDDLNVQYIDSHDLLI